MNTLVKQSRLNNKDAELLNDAMASQLIFTADFCRENQFIQFHGSGDMIGISEVHLTNSGYQIDMGHLANIERISSKYISVYTFTMGQRVTAKISVNSIIEQYKDKTYGNHFANTI